MPRIFKALLGQHVQQGKTDFQASSFWLCLCVYKQIWLFVFGHFTIKPKGRGREMGLFYDPFTSSFHFPINLIQKPKKNQRGRKQTCCPFPENKEPTLPAFGRAVFARSTECNFPFSTPATIGAECTRIMILFLCPPVKKFWEKQCSSPIVQIDGVQGQFHHFPSLLQHKPGIRTTKYGWKKQHQILPT